MNIDDFCNILKNPKGISPEQIQKITSILEEYPYFHAARALHLKILYAQKDYKYNRALKVAAAHITNRTVLYDFISSHASTENIIKPKEEKTNTVHTQQESFRIPAWFYDISVVSEEISPNKKEEVSTENSSHSSDNKDKSLSFSEWLKVTRYTVNNPEKEDIIDENKKNKFELIDRFLETNPKIEPSKDYVPSNNLADNSRPKETMLMTETLAKIYLEQRKFKEAIQAYEILILKNPEKSGFFADQIRAIKNLQQNNL